MYVLSVTHSETLPRVNVSFRDNPIRDRKRKRLINERSLVPGIDKWRLPAELFVKHCNYYPRESAPAVARDYGTRCHETGCVFRAGERPTRNTLISDHRLESDRIN